MEEKYSVEFDEDFINKTFSCKLCKKLLSLPIMLIGGLGDICDPCFQAMGSEEKEHHIISENISLGTFLKRIPFPCQFKCHGCEKKIPYVNLMDHENNCIYRIIPCIFPKCNLTCTRLGIKMHIAETHKDKILSKEDDISVIETNILEDSDICRIFDTTLAIFIIRITVVANENKLRYAIYDFDNEARNYSFKIDNVYDDKLYSNLSAKFVYNIDQFFSHDVIATELDYGSIKNSNDKTIKTLVKIWKQGENVFDVDKLKLFECPVCHDLMRAPIYQCTVGHSLCSKCKPNLTSCPICRGDLGDDIRNYILEEMSQFVSYPCRYKGNGCRAKSISVTSHESCCYYKDYACFFSNCEFRGRRGLFLDHLREEHGQSCFSKNINVSLGSSTTSNQIYCILFEKQIFKISLKHDRENIQFAVEYVIFSESSSEYAYEFCIVNKNNDNERIILIKQNCKFLPADKETEKHSLHKNDLVKSFAGENDVYNYLITIYRNNEGIDYNLGGKNKVSRIFSSGSS